MYLYCNISQKNPNHRALCLNDTTIQQNSYTVGKLCHPDAKTRHPDEGTRHPDAQTSHPEVKKSHPCAETSLPVDGKCIYTTKSSNGLLELVNSDFKRCRYISVVLIDAL